MCAPGENCQQHMFYALAAVRLAEQRLLWI